MADLRPRSRRHALLAADANHARECRPAQGGVGVSHAAARAPSRRPARAAAAAAGSAEGDTPERRPAAAAGGADAAGRASAPSEVTPLVIDGIMYLSTPYSRVVALDPTTGKNLGLPLPAGSPSTRGVEYWPGDAADAGADRLRFERRQVVLAQREDRQAERGVRR